MRFMVVTAIVCFSAVTLSVATDATAAVRKDVNIPAQQLAPALKTLARDRGFQLVFRSEVVGSARTLGASGELTTSEALTRLLEGTHLSFSYLDEKTVTILAAGSADQQQGTASTRQVEGGEQDPFLDRSRVTRLAEGNSSGAPTGEGSKQRSERRTGVASISGHVSDAAARINLPGALVRVLETGATVKTDDLGNFRVRGLEPGTYTLFVSYIGYADRHWSVTVAALDGVQEFPLLKSDQDALQEVTVYGTRSARALALNQQRTAENSSSIVSADMLGNFTGTTISEALRRTEGIAFERDPETGDGTGISIRGLAPDFNSVKLNGISLPSGFGRDNSANARSSDLSYLLADSISKITVNYSLLPSHDSAGTGGLVEIETKSPLDRPHRFANFSVERAQKGGDFGDDFLATGTVSGTFGAEQDFGFSTSVQYRDRSTRNFGYNVGLLYGPFMPLDEQGGFSIDSPGQLAPAVNFPFEPESDGAYPMSAASTLSDVDVRNLTVAISGAWHVADHTDLRLDVQHSTDQRDSFALSSRLSAQGINMPLPIVALGGEIRNTLAWSESMKTTQEYRALQDVEKVTDTYAFNGTTALDKFDLEYRVGYSSGTNRSPKETIMHAVFDSSAQDTSFDPAFVSASAIDPIEGRVISPWGERTGRGYPVALLTPEGFAFFNDTETYVLDDGSSFPIGSRITNKGYNYRADASSSLRYNVGGANFRYVEIGFDAERAKFATSQQRTLNILPRTCDLDTMARCDTIGDIGLELTEGNLAAIGQNGGLLLPSRASFEAFANGLERNGSKADYPLFLRDSPVNELFTRQLTEEMNVATYLQARLDFGKLEIIGGARLSRVDVRAVNINTPILFREGEFNPDSDFQERYTQLFDESATGTDVLPRVLFNYRLTDNFIVRAGYFLTIARPSVNMLSRQSDIFIDLNRFYGPAGDQPLLGVEIGNPALEPAKTNNIDLSAEYYDGQIGLIRLSAFYKRTKNNIQTNSFGNSLTSLDGLALPDIPELQELPEDIYIQGGMPENSPFPTELWGGTVSFERQFTFLPGILSGLGIQTNFTYTGSTRHDRFHWLAAPVYDADGNLIGRFGEQWVDLQDERYNGQSAGSGSFAVTYNKYAIDASLAYTDQARAQQGYAPNGFTGYTERYNSLDLRIAKEFRARWCKCTAFFEGTDLLKGTSSPDLESSLGGKSATPKVYTSGSFIGGRSYRLGIRANF